MTTAQILLMLAGGVLVALGVVAGAVADRIRGARREAVAPRFRPSKNAGAHPVQAQSAHDVDISDRRGGISGATAKMALDVKAALVTAGYDKQTAQLAVEACAGSERATLETWTRAALRRAMSSSTSGVLGTDARSARGKERT